MKKKLMIIMMILTLSWCSKSDEIPYEAGDNEIALQIQLDIKEDIGLLIVDYEANDSSGSGGTSNADKSLLKHDELLIYTLDKQNFKNPSDVENLSIQFSIITEYVDPNYENIYPEEYTKEMDAIALHAKFGESYYITITGDKINGYEAVLEK